MWTKCPYTQRNKNCLKEKRIKVPATKGNLLIHSFIHSVNQSIYGMAVPCWAHSVHLSEIHPVLICNGVDPLSRTRVEKIPWPLWRQKAAIFLQERMGPWVSHFGDLAESFAISWRLQAHSSNCLRGRIQRLMPSPLYLQFPPDLKPKGKATEMRAEGS